jgi:Holliday junction resolvase RusA-like endonuclease
MYTGYGAGMEETKGTIPTKIQTFIVRMNPVAKGRPRFTKTGRTYTPKKTKEATDVIAKKIKENRGEQIGKRPVSLGKGDKVLKTTKPDVDNYLKLVMDACNQSGVWEDDSQVVEVLAQKWYCADYQEPEIQIQISRL